MTLTFTDDREYQYFCVFRDQTSFELAGTFDPSLWRTLVVEACNNESIRELTTAVAALDIADKQSKNATMDSRNFQNDMNSNLEYALLQYGKALKGIQSTVSAGQDSLRIALIAALLIFVFESLHGDTGRALTPIQISIELILKRLSTMQRPYRGSLTNANKTPSSLPVDEDLLMAFIRLDGLALSLVANPSRRYTHLLDRLTTLSSTGNRRSEIPSGFATVSEARKYYDDISWRSETLPDELRGTLRSWYSDPLDKEADSTATQLSKWIQAFTPLFQHSLTAAGTATFISASILQINALTQILFLNGFETQEPFHTTRTVMSLTRGLVEHPNFSRRFVFDAGILPAMLVLIVFCPVKETKEEAYELVKAMIPRREGVLSSLAIAKAAGRFLQKKDESYGSSSAEDSFDLRYRGLDFDNFMGKDMYDFGMQGIDIADEEMIDPVLLATGSSQSDKGKAVEYYTFGTHLKVDPELLKEFLGF